MIPRLVPAALLTALSLNGCAAPGGGSAIIDDHADVTTRMLTIANRFEQDRRRGGISEVVADIDQCYASATRFVVQTFALRDCLVLDYVGYWTDVNVGRRAFKTALPFFEDQVASQRWGHYGPLAQFDTPQRLLAYLANSNGLVQIDLAQISRAPARGNRTAPPRPATQL
jgi:hypothetical protein